MFRMYGRTVQVLKYQITYTENEEEQIDYAASEEEANEIAQRTGGTVTALDMSDDAWMDGIEVADVPDTYGEAMEIYHAGESAYRESVAQIDNLKITDMQQMRADIDFLAAMTGVEL